jgi:hypothetical protein
MTSFAQVTASYPAAGSPYFTRLVSRDAQGGSVLYVNTSSTVTVMLTNDPQGNPSTVDASPLGPNQSIVFDGTEDVYCFTTAPGTSAVLGVFPSGSSFFQPPIVNGSTLLNTNQLLYSPTIGAGNLIASMASAAGTDPFGNPYKRGVSVYDEATGTFVNLDSTTSARMSVGTGDVAEAIPGYIDAFVNGSGPGRNIVSNFSAAAISGQPNGAGAAFQLESYSPDLSVLPAAFMTGTDGTNTNFIEVNPIAIFFNIRGTSVVQFQSGLLSFAIPITLAGEATPGAPASGCNIYGNNSSGALGTVSKTGFSGYPPVSQSDSQTITQGGTTTAIAITRTWNIPANDAVVTGGLGTLYEVETHLNGTVEAATAIQFGIMLDGTFTNIVPITPGFAAGDNVTGDVKLKLLITTTGAVGTSDEAMNGTFQDGTATRTPSTSMVLDGIRTAVAIDTTVAHTIAIGCKFVAVVAGQTISGIGSKFTRYGL